MEAGANQRRVVEPKPLTAKAFGAYGEIVEYHGDQKRCHIPGPLRHRDRSMEPAFWVTRATSPMILPARIRQLERHLFSAQTFVPLRCKSYLVVVAPDSAGAGPDLGRLEVFLAEEGQGVCYHPRTWHHGLTVLSAPADFVVMMSVFEAPGGDEIFDLPSNYELIVSAQ
jgi:ureidoglycolate lyase